MATVALARDDDLGTLVASLGPNNIYSVSTNEGLIDITTGINGVPAAITKPFLLRLTFYPNLTGSAANVPHLKVDGFDCGPILNSYGSAVADGDLLARPVLVLGDMAAATDTKVTRARVLDLLPSDIAALAGNSFPIGGILPFSGQNIPTGFLIANGAILSRVSYPKLWAHAQASGALADETTWEQNFGYQSFYSVGDGYSNFRLPNLNGLFLRALDSGRGVDPSRILGTTQSDAFRSHTHGLTQGGVVISGYAGTAPAYVASGSYLSIDTIAAAGGPETRPYNAAYPFLIRAY
ncbi:MAG: tail fiber protein [Parafilimonas terrae]|nr:tail fiber protein [Parafilimonas terrae]